MKRYIVEIQDLESKLSDREIFKAIDDVMLDIAENYDDVFIDVTEYGDDDEEDWQLKSM